ncbi:MAG: Mth938-like domain-containing protein [Pseudomonadota bacterium]
MKITQQPTVGINLIRRYGADFITLGEEDIRASCLVTAATLTRDWAPRTVEELKMEHLSPLFELAPEIVVLATGPQQTFPRAALRAEFATRRIGFEVMEVGAACRTYNVLVGEERRVLAAILLPGSGKGSG